MKLIRKLALEKDFFNRYVFLIKDVSKIKTITQSVSAITAVAIWWSLSDNNLRPLIGWASFVVSGLFAVVASVGVEIGLRKFLPYAVQSVLFERWQGLDGAMSFFIIPICLALLVASGWTSFQGSYAVVETVAPVPELLTTTEVDSSYLAKVSDSKSLFQSDSITIATTFNNQITAAAAKYSALSTSHLNKAEQYKVRSKRVKGKANKDYLIVLESRELNKADVMTGKKDSVIAEIETAKGAKLLTLIETRRTDKTGIDTTYAANTNKIESTNTTLLSENEALINNYGLGLGWITIICLLIFIALTILEEIHKKGSEQKTTVVYSQLDLLPSVWTRYFNYVNEFILGGIHRKLDEWENNLQPLPMPEPLPALYYTGEQEQEKIEVDSKASNNKNIYEFSQYSLNKKASENITATIEIDPTSKGDLTDPKSIVYNDLSLGQKNDKSDPPKKVVSGQIFGEKNCLHCGEVFQYKNSKKKYCSDSCRIAFWENKTGRKFGKNKEPT